MRAAQQMLAGAVEEPVGQPVERRADMRAGIDIGMKRAAAADDEHGDLLGARAEAEAAALALRHLVGAAEPHQAHALIPAILVMSVHSSQEIRPPDSLPCRTSPNSLSLGSALIAASVTGVLT